ncbi:hypothetical protein D3C79_403190 [compost metagenome]
MCGFFFAFGTLRQDIGTALLGTVKGDAAALDQHPAADNVVNHQQQEPDGNRGLQACQQFLCGGQIADGGSQRSNQRCGKQQPPQRGVDHVFAGAFVIQIQWNTGPL